MKFFILLFPLMTFFHFLGDTGFYGITFNNISGTPVNTESYRGKKVIVVLITTDSLSKTLVCYLDSVQRSRTDVQVLAVPTGEFGGNISDTALINLQQRSLITVTRPLKVKKSNNSSQHPLFAWLTNVAKNRHFDSDADEEGKIFFVSRKGTMYGVLIKQAPRSVLSKVINKEFKE